MRRLATTAAALVALLAVLAGCGGHVVRTTRPPAGQQHAPSLTSPRRVLLSLDTGAVARLADRTPRPEEAHIVGEQLVRQLRELGFEGTVLEERPWDSVVDFARAHGFGLVLRARVDLVARLEVPGSVSGLEEYFGLRLSFEVVDSERGQRTEADARAMYVVEHGYSAGDAMARGAPRLALAASAPLTLALAAQPRVARLMQREPDSELARRLGAHGAQLRAMRELRQAVAVGVVEGERRDRTTSRVALLTEPLGEAYHVADLGSDGAWLMLREKHFADLAIGSTTGSVRAESEALLVVTPNGRTRLVEEQLEFDAFPVAAADGRTVVAGTRAPQGPGELVRYDLVDGSRVVLRRLAQNALALPTVSRDGQRIVYRLTRDQMTALHVVDRDGANDRELLAPQAFVGSPELSADGRVAWIATGDTRRDSILRVDLDTGQSEVVLGWRAGPGRGNAASGLDPRVDSAFSYAIPLPDESALIVAEHDANGHYIGRYELDGSQAYRRLTSLTIARRVELSPDGRWLAIDTNDTLPSWPPSADHDVEIVLIDTATGAVVRVTDNATDDRLGEFSSDGRALYIRQATLDPLGRLMTSRIYRYAPAELAD